MATLPTFPVFTRNDYQLAKLQALSAAVAFACRAPVIFHLYKTGNQSIPGATLTAVNWDAASADSDFGWQNVAPSRYIVQTPGYFHCDWGVNCTTSATDGLFTTSLRVTSGANNPAGGGVVSYVSARDDDIGAFSTQESLAGSAAVPYLYVLDYLEVVVACTQATTITAGWNSSGNNDPNGFPDGSPSFTGMLISLGP